MAHEIVVKESLSEALVRDGAELVRKLDQGEWRPSAALWFYLHEAEAWRLILAFPDLDVKGPRQAYTDIQNALLTMDRSSGELALENIGVVPSDHPTIALLRIAIDTGPVITEIRFSRNVINGHFIEDALIYRLM